MNELSMDRELMMEFVAESREHFDAVEDDLLVLERTPDRVEQEMLDRIFRAVHTVKGSAGFLGLSEVSRLSHVMETALARMRKGQLKPDRVWVEELLGGIDDLRKLLAAVCGERVEVDAGRIARMEQLLETPASETAPAPEPPVEGASPWGDVPAEFPRHLQIHWADLSLWQEQSGLSPLDLFSRLEKIGFVADAALRPVATRLSDVVDRAMLSLDVLFATAFSDDQVLAAVHLSQDQVLAVDEPQPGNTESGTAPAVRRTILFHPSAYAQEAPGALDALWTDLRKLGTLRLSELAGNPSGWSIELSTHASDDTIRDAFIFVEQGSEIIFQDAVPVAVAPAGAPEKPEPPPAVIGLPQPAGGRQAPGPLPGKGESAADSIRVTSEKLDQLVNLVGELVIVQAQLTAASARAADVLPDLQNAVESMQRLGAELREVVLNIRMMPIGNTFNKYRRMVRDLAAELGKEIDLEISGAETELDKTVIDQLGDPLVHLVRNSLDHGIEKPDVREKRGKSRRGTLSLTAEQQGDRVLITVSDDGNGLDTGAIRAKAVEQGLIAHDAKLSEMDIHQLVFKPGFSTAERVTSVSGRGVGMDVVRRRIELLRGSIEVRTESGRGTSFVLSLPLTLAIIEGLMVDVDGERFIVPLSLVTETIELTRARRHEANRRNLVDVRGALVPYLRLRDVFGFADNEADVERVVIVELEEQRLGLVVDRVLGNHQTVLKSLGRLCRDVGMFSGATILGDGAVALVLDVPGLLRSTGGNLGAGVMLDV